MHACGHDGHMAMVLGAATVLNKIRGNLKGAIKFLFQPAEEGPGGTKPMIDAGVMENPKVDYSMGCHVWPDIPQGTIGVRPGPIMAAMDRFDIEIRGKGGHPGNQRLPAHRKQTDESIESYCGDGWQFPRRQRI